MFENFEIKLPSPFNFTFSTQKAFKMLIHAEKGFLAQLITKNI
jgi:hypothetical protein